MPVRDRAACSALERSATWFGARRSRSRLRCAAPRVWSQLVGPDCGELFGGYLVDMARLAER
jgi:hypothetical protein